MSEMKRLLDEAVSADAERILRSAEIDAPSSAEEKQARIVDALGVDPSPDGGTPSTHSRSFFRIGKWAALAALIVMAGVLASRPAPTSVAGVARPPPITAPSAAEPPRASAPPPPPEQGVHVEDLPSVRDISSSRRPTPPTPPIVAEDELVMIDAARAALAAGRARDTLARVADCRTKFPRPLYAEEADALEVQALSALGRRDEARAKGERFFASHPHSAYEPRVRAAIGAVQP